MGSGEQRFWRKMWQVWQRITSTCGMHEVLSCGMSDIKVLFPCGTHAVTENALGRVVKHMVMSLDKTILGVQLHLGTMELYHTPRIELVMRDIRMDNTKGWESSHLVHA